MEKDKCFLLIIVLLACSCFSAEAGERYKYTYQLAERPDPFAPFFRKPKPVPDIKVPLLPPPKIGDVPFEPGQLKLTAVVFSRNQWIAVVEDVTGKGYFVNKGTTIGSYGTVKNIEAGQMLVEESYQNPYNENKAVVKNTILRLQQKGDR